MTDEERIYLHELNETYTDGFVRGYNRGFMDGIYTLANIYEDKELLKKMGVEVNMREGLNDEETEA